MHSDLIPASELPVYNQLLELKKALISLKNNRKEYMKSSDVKNVYRQVLNKYHELKQLRRAELDTVGLESTTATSISSPLNPHNKVDSLLDEIFQLLSLSFMTVGLTNTAPATYASLSTVQRLLEHLVESKVYTIHDLHPIKERLNAISKIVLENNKINNTIDDSNKVLNPDENSISFEEHNLLTQKLEYCLNEYKTIEKNMEQISPELMPYLDKLITLRRNLLSLVSKAEGSSGFLLKSPDDKLSSNSNSFVSSFSNSDKIENSFLENISQLTIDDKINNNKLLTQYKDLLKKLETDHRDENGDFLNAEDNTEITNKKGQQVLNGLLDDCHYIINDLNILLHDHESSVQLIDEGLIPLYNKLIKIKTSLENLLVTRRWTLRETDLFNYQKELQKIDDLRINGKFKNLVTNKPYSKGQTMLLYLLRRCYALIYKLLESSEPVSESLQPIHNQLSTVRRCLLDLKRMGGINSTRELYPYQMKLASLDDLRIDGKFIIDGEIPEGQGTLNALLAECYDICYELRVELEEREENEEEKENQSDDSRSVTKKSLVGCDGNCDDDDDDDDGDADEYEDNRQYDELGEEDYKCDYDYDSYVPSENVTDNELSAR